MDCVIFNVKKNTKVTGIAPRWSRNQAVFGGVDLSPEHSQKGRGFVFPVGLSQTRPPGIRGTSSGTSVAKRLLLVYFFSGEKREKEEKDWMRLGG